MMKSFSIINPDYDRLHADELADCVQALEDASQTLIQLYGNLWELFCGPSFVEGCKSESPAT